MAKSNFNGLNQWSGRIGGLVYKVVNGKQVIMPYQKKVFNPQTDAQMENRAKFSLASMINKITPKEVLQGMCEDRRKRRSLFFSHIMRNTMVSKTEEGYTATLSAEDLVFAIGEYAPVTLSEVRLLSAQTNVFNLLPAVIIISSPTWCPEIVFSPFSLVE